MVRVCGNCVFAASIGNPNGVACHRYPPSITKVEGDSITSHFPLVNNSSWCGEWRKAYGMADDNRHSHTKRKPITGGKVS